MTNRVLAAEDSPTQAALLRTYLEEAGFSVSMAANGAEALAQFDPGEFDIVVSDVVMPEVDGYELCQAVKERAPQVPVVLLTSLTDPLDVVRALAAGADNFLRKPYQPAELVHRLRNMVQNKQLRDTGRAQMGLELFFLGRRFMINAEREQILDLLVSTFEDLVVVNKDLQVREEQLAVANDDVTARLAEAELERDRLQAVLAALPEGMLVVDHEGVVVEANQNMSDLLGVSRSSLRGRRAWEAVSFVDHAGVPLEQDQQCIHKSLRGEDTPEMGTAFDLLVERDDGSRFPALARSAPIRSADGTVVGAVGVLEDIAALLSHDPVTGLPGHGILIDRLDGAMDSASEHGVRTGLLVVTIDRYERIREGLPANGGDRVVADVVARLVAALDSHEVRQRSSGPSAAYLGNGEVAVIVPDVDDEADAMVVGEIVADHLATSVDVDGVEVAVTVSVAVGMADAGSDPAQLISVVAAAARRLSGAGGGGVATSDPGLHAEVVQRLQREHELRAAITNGELVVHYQPKVDLHRGDAVAVEALVRWEHPEHGLLGAGAIIPLAVESGLIGPLGWSVLEQSCRQVVQWRRALAGAEDLLLSVNVAAEQLRDADVAGRVEHILATTGLDPTALILEITEGSVMEEPEKTGERLNAIKALGVRLAIDDFGTGYSSLLQLRRLPVDILKVDRTFVSGMVDRDADAAIVAATLGLARALGLQVVAEGVETSDQLARLQSLRCDLGQGYLWAPPLPGHDLEQWWSRWSVADRGSFPGEPPRTYGRRAGDRGGHLAGESDDPTAAAELAFVVEAAAAARERGFGGAAAMVLQHAAACLGDLDDESLDAR